MAVRSEKNKITQTREYKIQKYIKRNIRASWNGRGRQATKNRPSRSRSGDQRQAKHQDTIIYTRHQSPNPANENRFLAAERLQLACLNLYFR